MWPIKQGSSLLELVEADAGQWLEARKHLLFGAGVYRCLYLLGALHHAVGSRLEQAGRGADTGQRRVLIQQYLISRLVLVCRQAPLKGQDDWRHLVTGLKCPARRVWRVEPAWGTDRRGCNTLEQFTLG